MEGFEGTKQNGARTNPLNPPYPHMPEEQMALTVIDDRLDQRFAAWLRRLGWGGFFSLTGGSILYCLSGLSILYGAADILGKILVESKTLGQALGCVWVLNGYELALLGVLVLIVAWRHVTDDAISLIVLIAMFLVVSGMSLGTAAHHNPRVSMYIGFGCIGLGAAKLLIMRRWVGFRIRPMTLVGVGMILIWNFMTPVLMMRSLITAAQYDEVRRLQWLYGSIVLLTGGALVAADAARSKPDRIWRRAAGVAFIHTDAMVWVFALILLAAACVHECAIAYMFAVDRVLGDFVPVAMVGALLVIELMRSCGKRSGWIEAAVVCIPLGVALFAIADHAVLAGWSWRVEVLWYPPVMMAACGCAVLAVALYHKWPKVAFASIPYGVAALMMVGSRPGGPIQINWMLGGAAACITFIVLGFLFHRMELCVIGVLGVSVGLAFTGRFARFAAITDVHIISAVAGTAGLAIIAASLVLGKRAEKGYAAFGAFLLGIFLIDYFGMTPSWWDLAVPIALATLCRGLWVRCRDIWAVVLTTAPTPWLFYGLGRQMSSWHFVALSFLLLICGAFVSLFCKGQLINLSEPDRVDS